MSTQTVIDLPGLRLFKQGKVRNVYDFGDRLLVVSSDRISAFDVILPQGIPHKGEVLTQLSAFWFRRFSGRIDTHFMSVDMADFPEEAMPYSAILAGRSMLVKKTQPIEIECVVRGYLMGTGLAEYQKTGSVCGHVLPAGLQQASRLPEPIFTPAIKAASGHDENISIERCEQIIGHDLTQALKEKSVMLYRQASEYAQAHGILIADTKFEFGMLDGKVVLIDEIFTPDSSRFWPQEAYREGISPPSFDKQIVRDYLESMHWDKQSPAPLLPDSVIQKTSERYREILAILAPSHT